MAYATNEERKALKDMTANGIDNLPFVVRFKKGERENELQAEDFDHAFNLYSTWYKDPDVEYVEVFRVLHDGSLTSGGNMVYRAYREVQ